MAASAAHEERGTAPAHHAGDDPPPPDPTRGSLFHLLCPFGSNKFSFPFLLLLTKKIKKKRQLPRHHFPDYSWLVAYQQALPKYRDGGLRKHYSVRRGEHK
jgi:hypothetical protein